jgi:hypothetical protein
MTTLVLVSLGELNGALLELAARLSSFERIVVASRNLAKAEAKANNARIGAALHGCYPQIVPVEFDMYARDASRRLLSYEADVICAAPSMLPWWRVASLQTTDNDILQTAPFATFIACHLAPMMTLRDVYATSGSPAAFVGASAPDVVNAVLARTGSAPICGIGNVAEVIPKLRLALSTKLNCPPTEIGIRLVAQHAFEYYCLSSTTVMGHPPYLLSAFRGTEDVTPLARDLLFTPCPIPYELDFNLVTASAGLEVLQALAADTPLRTHVPAPNGLIGGYPVSVSRAGVELDLVPEWTSAEAQQVNLQSLPFDGIEGIDGDGTINFSLKTINALRHITGRRIECLAASDAMALAAEICARLNVR